jgi:hypothetical protein
MLPAPLERAGVRVAVVLDVVLNAGVCAAVFAVVGAGVVVLISTGLVEF